MAKYLVLYRASQAARERMASMSPAESKAGMNAWLAWATRIAPAVVDLGAPLGTATSLGRKAVAHDVGGFSVLVADSLDDARKLCDGHPHLMTGGWIELFEFVVRPGT